MYSILICWSSTVNCWQWEHFKLVLWLSIWNSGTVSSICFWHILKQSPYIWKNRHNSFSNGNTKQEKDVLEVLVQKNEINISIERLKRSSFFWVGWIFLRHIPQLKLPGIHKNPCSSLFIWCCFISNKRCKTWCAYLKKNKQTIYGLLNVVGPY